jgi:DNA-binding transcriptional ArsR family regulator
MFTRARSHGSIEFPILRLGLAGYTAAEEAHLAEAIRAHPREANWQLSRLSDADAWCVNGTRVQVLPDGTLRIAPGLSTNRSIRVNLADLDGPIAFSDPPAALNPACTFDAASADSIRAMTDMFENALRPTVLQFHLASRLVEDKLPVNSGAFHVSVRGHLAALVSMRSGAGVSLMISPADLRHAQWSRRPEGADDMPAKFVRIDFSQLMWQYATRTERDCLPAHYRDNRLYLRQPPRLPMQLLNDQVLLLVRELGFTPGRMGELAQRTGIGEPALSRHLGALYMVGSITADPRRAPAPRALQQTGEWSSMFSGASVSTGALEADKTVKLSVKRGAGGAGLDKVRYVED